MTPLPAAGPWRLRVAACRPLLPGVPGALIGVQAARATPAVAAQVAPVAAPVAEVLGALTPAERARLPALLCGQDLAALWQPLLRAAPDLARAEPALAGACDRAATVAAARYLLQRQVAAEAEAALTAAGIAHCRVKGAHLRELLYAEPFRRPADDIDLLIAAADRDAAIATLGAAGFDWRANPANLTHETTLARGPVAIDLHWEVVRPARLRRPLAPDLLASRRWFAAAAGTRADAGHWGPADDLHLLLLLTHPVFTKYTTTPQARVVRALDLAYWLALRPPDWPALVERLRALGLATAAWITLRWLARLTGDGALGGNGASNGVAATAGLAPPPLRRAWLDAWLRHDLASRLQHLPGLVPVAFTLPAQDRPADAWRLLRDRAGGSGGRA